MQIQRTCTIYLCMYVLCSQAPILFWVTYFRNLGICVPWKFKANFFFTFFCRKLFDSFIMLQIFNMPFSHVISCLNTHNIYKAKFSTNNFWHTFFWIKKSHYLNWEITFFKLHFSNQEITSFELRHYIFWIKKLHPYSRVSF